MKSLSHVCRDDAAESEDGVAAEQRRGYNVWGGAVVAAAGEGEAKPEHAVNTNSRREAVFNESVKNMGFPYKSTDADARLILRGVGVGVFLGRPGEGGGVADMVLACVDA